MVRTKLGKTNMLKSALFGLLGVIVLGVVVGAILTESVGVVLGIVSLVIAEIAILVLSRSIYIIGPTEMGIKKKLIGRKLPAGHLIALKGEAGYQPDILLAGVYLILWPLSALEIHPRPQVGANDILIILAQAGEEKPMGQKTAIYKEDFGSFADVGAFLNNGGQKGIQRPVFTGSTMVLHPIAFLAITKDRVYGTPIDEDVVKLARSSDDGKLSYRSFGLTEDQMKVTVIKPKIVEIQDPDDPRKTVEKKIPQFAMITTLEGPAVPPWDVVGRIGGFKDIEEKEKELEEPLKAALAVIDEQEKAAVEELLKTNAKRLEDLPKKPELPEEATDEEKRVIEERIKAWEKTHAIALDENERALRDLHDKFSDMKWEQESKSDGQLFELLMTSKNRQHESYQNYQNFLDLGGQMGHQFDVVDEGAFAWNPFLIKYELADWLDIDQGEVVVIKFRTGLATEDVSGSDFKYGSLVKPGHKGIWRYSIGVGNKVALNGWCFESVKVTTAILALNWAEASSVAHKLDKGLKQISAKSKEGFEFGIDLQVLIHIAQRNAPRLINAVGTLEHLVSEVLQPAVGNHFRDTLQSMPAVDFIDKRNEIQQSAERHVRQKLKSYEVETPGVLIQDVVMPKELIKLLQDRELARQRTETLKSEKLAEDQRKITENAKGIADAQAALAKSQVEIEVADNTAQAREKEGYGEKRYAEQIGEAEGAPIKSVGMALAESLKAQADAIGQDGTTIVNAVRYLSESKQPFVPEVMLGSGGSMLDAVLAMMAKDRLNKPKVLPTNKSEGEVSAAKDENLIAAGMFLQREGGVLPPVEAENGVKKTLPHVDAEGNVTGASPLISTSELADVVKIGRQEEKRRRKEEKEGDPEGNKTVEY